MTATGNTAPAPPRTQGGCETRGADRSHQAPTAHCRQRVEQLLTDHKSTRDEEQIHGHPAMRRDERNGGTEVCIERVKHDPNNRDGAKKVAAGQAAHDFNIAITSAVVGRTPRQTKNASAACSTNMPTPSAVRAPARAASCRNAVSPLPYIMS